MRALRSVRVDGEDLVIADEYLLNLERREELVQKVINRMRMVDAPDCSQENLYERVALLRIACRNLAEWKP